MAKAAPKQKQAQVKTTRTKASVAEFIAAVEDDGKRADAVAIDRMMREITGETPAMWGPTIIGYGSFSYTNTTGQADWPRIGFSPRKGNIVLYVMTDTLANDPITARLGKHKTGKSCLYINKLADVDQAVLREIAVKSWEGTGANYG
jgi:hypothetical protein